MSRWRRREEFRILLATNILKYDLKVAAAVEAVKVAVNPPSIQVTRGGSVLLPCSFRTTAALNRLNIIWTVSPLLRPRQPLQVISYEQGQIVESLSEYLGRVKFAFQPTQDASIFINHSRVSDTGTYQCTVINPPNGATPNIGLVGLTVLVPPSSPDCSSEGHGGESIQLRCSVKEGIPTPTITWEKMPPNGHKLISTQEDYRGSTTLTNLTSETSGIYRCTVTNQLGAQSCAVEIDIRVGGLGSMGVFAAITITLIMGSLLLALFALVLCLHRQSRGKWQEEVYRVVNTSSEQHHVTKWPCSDTEKSSRWPSGRWLPYNPTKLPPHLRYSVHQSPGPLRPTSKDSNMRRQQPRTPSEMDESEEDDEENTSPGLRSSIYSIQSGYLV
ncbi:immunoglobulin superfamily member 11-like [Rhinoderma darwinii]|uniref:immunoglobulin superfamily member 11-like n=1 Tax=Rhinoderma darwinii TaxID=43563 RepID=UPI003F6810FB